MKKAIIAVDMDDTICHLVKRAIHYNNLQFPTHPLRYEDMVTWDTTHLRHPDSTHDIFYGRPGLFEELELYDDYVVEEMQKLNEAYDVIIVTAADPATVVEKWNWLQRHMPFITAEQFITCKRKNLLGFDLLIDDGPHNLLPALAEGKKVLCIPHPWNVREREQHAFPLMKTWKDAKEIVDRLLAPDSLISN
ncbi:MULTISPECIES: 5' nucleotidase, NT5C type [Paenibacillus]|uniref:5' nucleotidase, NT5C type n=1 Tax=Paenibacillus TaxID=44249 RepID=UPI0030DAE9B6